MIKKIARQISHLGTIYFYVLLIVIGFFYDKRLGWALLISCFFIIIAFAIIKNLIKRKRPDHKNKKKHSTNYREWWIVKKMGKWGEKNKFFNFLHKFTHWMIRIDDQSFPSAHATRMGSLFLITSVFFKNAVMVYIALFLMILVSTSRIVIKRHYPDDTLAGLALGALIASFTLLIV
jgi:membrane-associated phospholipid phosphatase